MIEFTTSILYDGGHTITVDRNLGLPPKLLHVGANANDSWGSQTGW